MSQSKHNTPDDNSYLLPGGKREVQPLSSTGAQNANPAADEIRKKIAALYEEEPNTQVALQEAVTAGHRSKHQEYMHKLSTSGLPLAQIQAKWHEYYSGLPDTEKYEVWQEFYRTHGQPDQTVRTEAKPQQPSEAVQTPAMPRPAAPVKPEPTTPSADPLPVKPSQQPASKPETRTASDIKKQLLGKIQDQDKSPRAHQFKSLLFGLSMGSLVVLIMLFSFFNERIIAPFITPSRNVSSTPIIVDENSPVTDPVPKIIIPKINVEIPVVYDEPSIEEAAIQKALERGVVHYATTSLPGELGNAAIFGHSSNNILNKGNYKFAFVLLNRLEPGDTFYLTREGKRYVYRVYDKKVVKPTDVWVLGSTDRPATATLITCDPPGTVLNRLAVFGEQISPDPAANVASSAPKTAEQPTVVPGNAPSLWQRITGWFSS